MGHLAMRDKAVLVWEGDHVGAQPVPKTPPVPPLCPNCCLYFWSNRVCPGGWNLCRWSRDRGRLQPLCLLLRTLGLHRNDLWRWAILRAEEGARAVTWVREGDMGMVGKEQGLEARGSPAAPLRSTVGGVRVPGASNERDWWPINVDMRLK